VRPSYTKPWAPVEERQVVPVMVGNRCVGSAYNRGPAGWSAYDVNDIDLGLGRDFAHAVVQDTGGD